MTRVRRPRSSTTLSYPLTCMQKLLRSPTFNRAIHKAYRKINKIPDHEAKNGLGSMSIPVVHRLEGPGLICIRNRPFCIRSLQGGSQDAVPRAHMAETPSQVTERTDRARIPHLANIHSMLASFCIRIVRCRAAIERYNT